MKNILDVRQIKCRVSQPTLSIAINKLESRLGTTIFERMNHKLAITAIGKQIIKQARRILEEVDVLGDLVDSKSELSTPLKMGAIYTCAPCVNEPKPKYRPLLSQSN